MMRNEDVASVRELIDGAICFGHLLMAGLYWGGVIVGFAGTAAWFLVI